MNSTSNDEEPKRVYVSSSILPCNWSENLATHLMPAMAAPDTNFLGDQLFGARSIYNDR